MKRVVAQATLVAFLSLSLSLFTCGAAAPEVSPKMSAASAKATAQIVIMFELGLELADARRDENGNAIFPKNEGGDPAGAAGEHYSSQEKLMGSRLETTGKITTIIKEPFAYEETIEYTMSMELCPDAKGDVPLELSFKKSVGLLGGGEQLGVESKVTGHVNDEGTLLSWDASSVFSGARQPIKGGGENSGTANTSFEYQLDMTLSTNPGIPVKSTGSYIRQSSQQDETFVKKAVKDMNWMRDLMANNALFTAERRWKNGYCVEVKAEGETVQPNSETPFIAKVRHKWEGTDLTVPVIATLTGGQVSVKPSGSKVPAPATFTYKAPDKSDQAQESTVSLETRSNRGIAKRDILFRIAKPRKDSWSGTSSTVGKGEFTGMAWTAQVTWVYDPLQSHDGYAVYHPEGTVTYKHKIPCISISPSSYKVTQADGELVINNNTNPPTYIGSASTDWSATGTNTCEGVSYPGQQVGNSWFMTTRTGEEIPLVGDSIAGTWTIGNLTVTYSFTRD